MKLFLHFAIVLLAGTLAAQDNKWEKDIRAFEERDKKDLPPQGGIVFVGSSSIRLWNLKKSFPELPAVNRGFGGSQLADSVTFADRIVIPHKPRMVVLYAGDNDIASGKKPDHVAADFSAFVKKIHDALPEAKITYIAIKPSIQRLALVEKMKSANEKIQETCKRDKRLLYVDIFTPMLGEDGKPRPELFQKDGLHLNAEGYKLWDSILAPHLR